MPYTKKRSYKRRKKPASKRSYKKRTARAPQQTIRLVIETGPPALANPREPVQTTVPATKARF